VFENRVLRKIFGPKTEKATGEWRRLHTEELYGKQVTLHKIFFELSNIE
jgi:hypothetical protein